VANKEKLGAPKLGLPASIRKDMASEKLDVDGRLNARTGVFPRILVALMASPPPSAEPAHPQTFRTSCQGCRSRSRSWLWGYLLNIADRLAVAWLQEDTDKVARAVDYVERQVKNKRNIKNAGGYMRAVWESGNDVTDVDVSKREQSPTVQTPGPHARRPSN
jgi:hypothetical protein